MVMVSQDIQYNINLQKKTQKIQKFDVFALSNLKIPTGVLLVDHFVYEERQTGTVTISFAFFNMENFGFVSLVYNLIVCTIICIVIIVTHNFFSNNIKIIEQV